MRNNNPLVNSVNESKIRRPLVIKIICIAGFIISTLEIVGGFYATQINGSDYENVWTIYLKLIPFIRLIR